MIPFIPIAIAVGTGLFGAAKASKAASDNRQAQRYNNKAEELIANADKTLEAARQKCEKTLSELGKKKMQAMTQEMAEFVAAFEQLKNVELDSKVTENLQLAEFGHLAIDLIKHDIALLRDFSTGVGAGSAAGALTAFGAYSGTVALATASTGTAISTLSGAAASNAALAWIGGGTLASGGAGVVGGMYALGGLAAGPALAITGWYMGNKAEKNLNNARSNVELAEKYAADVATSVTLTNGITQLAKQVDSVLTQLRIHSLKSNLKLTALLDSQGSNYAAFDETGKDTVLIALKNAQALKALIDTPILNENGELLDDAKSKIAGFLAEKPEPNQQET